MTVVSNLRLSVDDRKPSRQVVGLGLRSMSFLTSMSTTKRQGKWHAFNPKLNLLLSRCSVMYTITKHENKKVDNRKKYAYTKFAHSLILFTAIFLIFCLKLLCKHIQSHYVFVQFKIKIFKTSRCFHTNCETYLNKTKCQYMASFKLEFLFNYISLMLCFQFQATKSQLQYL